MAQVYVSVGSNIDREFNIRSAIRALRAHYEVLQLSTVYDCPAIGFEGDDFYNLVVAFDTDEDVMTVVQVLHGIECDHQRSRGRRRFASRTLDLDLLLYDDLILSEERLTLPRDEISRYAFVLGPLAEIAGERRHPFNGKRFAALWAAFDSAEQPMRAVADFDWDARVEPQAHGADDALPDSREAG